jgi:hypothetical protein
MNRKIEFVFCLNIHVFIIDTAQQTPIKESARFNTASPAPARRTHTLARRSTSACRQPRARICPPAALAVRRRDKLASTVLLEQQPPLPPFQRTARAHNDAGPPRAPASFLSLLAVRAFTRPPGTRACRPRRWSARGTSRGSRARRRRPGRTPTRSPCPAATTSPACRRTRRR